MAEGGVNIDKELFGKRLKLLYDHWKVRGAAAARLQGAAMFKPDLGAR